VCPRTSAFLSSDDEIWTRAVFAGQPWALAQVFGLDARGAPVEALFGWRHGRLRRRPCHLLDHFEPTP
jgi:hypothetical protein